MEWAETLAAISTGAAFGLLVLWRRERWWTKHHRERANRWRAELQGEELRRAAPFLAPAAERIEAGQLVVVKNDGTVAPAVRRDS